MTPPTIENAPGLVWRRRAAGYAAIWRARADLVRQGYRPKNSTLWSPSRDQPQPSEIERAWIIDRCNVLQSEMLVWGRGGIPVMGEHDGTLRGLIEVYQVDPDSTYHQLRHKTRLNYTANLARIIAGYKNETAKGETQLADINARLIKSWHREWIKSGVSMAHMLIGLLRTLVNFGATILEDEDCERLSVILHKLRFENHGTRKERLTAEQVEAIRREAHKAGLHSIALAQALQFECTLRQRDVIGEWTPQSEPGISDVLIGDEKWLRGLRWEEIDNLILTHKTSKKGKDVVVNLALAPMVMEELGKYGGQLPKSGPVIVFENSGLPYYDYQWRREWRDIARAAGVPDKVYNMDTRSGAISEATGAGADLNLVRHAAAHSNISTTQGYDRTQADATEKVMKLRVAARNKTRT